MGQILFQRTCTEGQFCGTQVNSSGHTFKGCLRMEQCKKPIDIRTYKPATVSCFFSSFSEVYHSNLLQNGSSKWSVVITACCDTDLCNAPLGCSSPSITTAKTFTGPSSTTTDHSEATNFTTSAISSDSTTPNSVSSTENAYPNSEFGMLIITMLSYLLL